MPGPAIHPGRGPGIIQGFRPSRLDTTYVNPNLITEDTSAPPSGTSTSTTFTSSSFTPVANSLIIAIGVVGNTTGAGVLTGPITDSLSNTWTPLKIANGSGFGTVVVYAMDAGSSPAPRTVTITGTGGANAIGVALTVKVLLGAKPVASQTGASNSFSGTSAYSLALTPTKFGSMVYGGLVNIINATGALVPNGSTNAIQSILDGTRTEKYGTFSSINSTTSPGFPITYGYTNTPATTQTMAAVEIIPTDGSFVEVFGSAVLSGQSTLDVLSSVTTTGASAMSAQSTLNVVGTVTTSGVTALSGQSSLIASGAVALNGVAVLSGQSTMTVVGSTSVTGVSALSAQSSMTVTGSVIVKGVAVLSAQSTMVTVTTVTTSGVVVLSGQSSVSVLGKATSFGVSALSAQSSLTATGFAITSGASVLSGQSNLTVSATVGTTPPSAVLSAQSNMTVVGSVTVKGSAVLSAQSTMAVVSKVTTNGIVVLSGQSSMTVIGTRKVFGIVALSAQSSLSAIGRVPEILNGIISMSAIFSMTIVVTSAPPWTFRFIEFDGNRSGIVKVDNTPIICIKEDKYISRITNAKEAKSTTVSMEGG